MLSCFSYVRLFATLWTVARQAPRPMGLSHARILQWVAMPSSRESSWPRDKTCVSLCFLHWQAGSLPLGPPEKPQVSACVSHSVVFNSETPWTVAHQAPLSMEFSGQECWNGLPVPFQGIFLTQGSNPGLLRSRQFTISATRKAWVSGYLSLKVMYLNFK